MGTTVASVTILFEAPFWIGLYEREKDGRYEVCKITFGAEPKEYEVYAFLLEHCRELQFSPVIETAVSAEKHVNPKRMQRLIQKQMKNTGVGTKAQQALKLQHEQGALARKQKSRVQRDEEKDRQFALRQKKRKEKHRGH